MRFHLSKNFIAYLEDVEDASGEGEQECGLGEKGRHESSKMESGS